MDQFQLRAKFQNALDEGEVHRVVFNVEDIAASTRGEGVLNAFRAWAAFAELVVDDAKKIARSSQNMLDVGIPCRGRARSHRDQLGKPDDRIERHAQFLVELGAEGTLFGR